MDGDFWFRALGMIALLGALFVYPVVTLIRDERRTSAARELDGQQPSTDHTV